MSGKTEFNDLVKIKLDLSEQGIKLQYKKIVFDKYDDLVLMGQGTAQYLEKGKNSLVGRKEISSSYQFWGLINSVYA